MDEVGSESALQAEGALCTKALREISRGSRMKTKLPVGPRAGSLADTAGDQWPQAAGAPRPVREPQSRVPLSTEACTEMCPTWKIY